MNKTHRRILKISKRKTYRQKIKNHNQTQKGGDIQSLNILSTMISYGLYGVTYGPAYLLAELLNLPLTNVNTFAQKSKSINDNKSPIFHRPWYQFITDPSRKEMDPDDFLLEKDVYIHQRIALVSNDQDPNPFDEKGNPVKRPVLNEKDFSPGILSQVKNRVNPFYNPVGYDKFKDNLFRLFEYIESIKETDADKTKHIHKFVYEISDYKTLIKFYLIYKAIQGKCDKYTAMENVNGKERHKEKTILRGQDVVTIVNPFYNPRTLSYEQRIKCLEAQVSGIEITKDDKEYGECRVCCDTCTFSDSVSRLGSSYFSRGLILPAIALLSSGTAGYIAATGIVTSVGDEALATSTDEAQKQGEVAKGLISGGTGLLVAGAFYYSIYYPTYSTIIIDMIDGYFPSITITNKKLLINLDPPDKNDKEYETKYKSFIKRPFLINKEETETNSRGDDIGKVYTNIINILDELKVETSFKEDTEEKEVVIKKFHRFMCKYKIVDMIKGRIVHLYNSKIVGGAMSTAKSPSKLLAFIGAFEDEDTMKAVTPSIFEKGITFTYTSDRSTPKEPF